MCIRDRVPWLLALDARAGLGRALLGGLALAIAFAAAGFALSLIHISEPTRPY